MLLSVAITQPLVAAAPLRQFLHICTQIQAADWADGFARPKTCVFIATSSSDCIELERSNFRDQF